MFEQPLVNAAEMLHVEIAVVDEPRLIPGAFSRECIEQRGELGIGDMAAINKGGMKIGSIKLHSDGTIELISEQSVLATPANDFDRLDAEGLL